MARMKRITRSAPVAGDVVAILVMRRDPDVSWRGVVGRRRVIRWRRRDDDGRDIDTDAPAIAVIIPPGVCRLRRCGDADSGQPKHGARGGQALREGTACG